MNMIKKYSACILCTLALVLSVLLFMPASEAHANSYSYWNINADGTCYSGDLSNSGSIGYCFTISSYSLVQVTVTSSDNSADFTLYYDMNQNSAVTTDSRGQAILQAGDYYIEVTGSSDYTLSVNSKTRDTLDAEPNDGSSTAITMASGTSYTGEVYTTANDEDWYKLKLTATSNVYFNMPGVTTAAAYFLNEDLKLVDFGFVNKNFTGGYSIFQVLEPGTYYLRVYANSSNGGGKYTIIPTVVERPTANEVTKVSVTAIGKATVTWSESSYADGYYLFKKYSENGSWSRIATITSGSTTSYTDTSAPWPGSTCYYGVQAYKTDPVFSQIYNQDDAEGFKYTGKVPAPKNVSVSKINGPAIKVKWGQVANASGYKIYRKANGGSYILVKTITSGSTTSWNNSSVKKGTNYTYKVRAYYNNGSTNFYSSYSSTANTKITGSISAPSGVKAKKYSSYNKVTWNKISYVTGYKIYRKTGSGSYKLVKTTTSSDTVSYKDTNVKSGKKYTYKVKAYYKNYTYSSAKGKYTYTTKNSSYSKIASVTR